jgi:ElaB/YqjD/DUF883 family membrane-anchored ribosome-binding protein
VRIGEVVVRRKPNSSPQPIIRLIQITMEMNFSTILGSRHRHPRERLLAGLRSLAEDAEDLIKSTTETANEKASLARTRLSDTLERARDTCEELQHQSIRTARAAAKQADRTVRRHPYESVGIALGIGALLMLLFRRR